MTGTAGSGTAGVGVDIVIGFGSEVTDCGINVLTSTRPFVFSMTLSPEEASLVGGGTMGSESGRGSGAGGELVFRDSVGMICPLRRRGRSGNG